MLTIEIRAEAEGKQVGPLIPTGLLPAFVSSNEITLCDGGDIFLTVSRAQVADLQDILDEQARREAREEHEAWLAETGDDLGD